MSHSCYLVAAEAHWRDILARASRKHLKAAQQQLCYMSCTHVPVSVLPRCAGTRSQPSSLQVPLLRNLMRQQALLERGVYLPTGLLQGCTAEDAFSSSFRRTMHTQTWIVTHWRLSCRCRRRATQWGSRRPGASSSRRLAASSGASSSPARSRRALRAAAGHSRRPSWPSSSPSRPAGLHLLLLPKHRARRWAPHNWSCLVLYCSGFRGQVLPAAVAPALGPQVGLS